MAGPLKREHVFASRDALAASLALAVAAALRTAIASRNTATIAVSGGTTPVAFFKALSAAALDWRKVVVTLVDERFVEETSPRSNAGLAKTYLLHDKAAHATFVALAAGGSTVEAAALSAEARIAALGLPLDVAVLGMGTDGHTASFFPDAPELASLLDPAGKALVAPVHAPSGGEPRLTLTLPVLAAARALFLHIEGEAKRTVLATAKDGDDLPIKAVLAASPRPVAVYWAP